MTTLSIDTVAFEVAADAAHQANTTLAAAHDTLATALVGTAAMAGTDTPGAAFADAYDTTAQTALDHLADLVTALAGLAHATDLTRFHHLTGDAAAHPWGVLTTLLTDPGTLLGTRALIDPGPATIPDSLGGDTTSLPSWANTILDHVGGFVWPDARTDLLRTAGSAWATAADAAATVPETLWMATSNLEVLRSPEITLMLEKYATATTAAVVLHDQLTSLAATCTDYADAVDEHRTQILDLAHDLLRDTALMQAGGLLLDLVTGVGGTAAATTAALAEISARAPEFARILETLLDLARGFATTLHTAGDTIRTLGPRLTELLHLRWAGEGGEAAITLHWMPVKFLRYFERMPGAHTLEKHVGLSDDMLRARMAATGRDTVSTFYDEDLAEAAIVRVLLGRGKDIDAWLAGPKPKMGFSLHCGADLGRVLEADGTISVGQSARIVLVRDRSMPEGWRILTAYVEK